ncbi:MAG TPA: acyl-CoA dehydrogenase family protein [Acidimicrobiales bacterium]|nr:acyl-CoA dehydrogenase family protein [Acidimicrobiales bacterium]
MDFTLSEEQQAIADLAAQIFEDQATPERVKEVEGGADRIDRGLWAKLAEANLLGIALPEDAGGSGYGIVELCLVLEQQGRRVAPVPLLPTLVMGALPIAQLGTTEQRARWLPGVATGEVVLTAALAEVASGTLGPGVAATPDGSAWRLDGAAVSVPAAHLAARVLVPARRPGGDLGVYLVDPGASGVARQAAQTTDRGVAAHLTFTNTPIPPEDVLGGDDVGDDTIGWILDRAMVGLCALQVGVAEEALRMAAEYTSARHQFGRPLATFQGAALKAADAYIDTEAMRATMWQAAWRMSQGMDATDAVAVAKWWAADAGHRVVHTTQHLHGGLGADVDYPIHRYFLWGKQIEVTLGGASQQLARLGREIAAANR